MMVYCCFFARRAFLLKNFALSIKRLGTAGLDVLKTLIQPTSS
jgi:hypothetical protein